MAPRLGADYPLEIEMTSKPKADYQADEWADTDLPTAPAVMVGEEVIAEGSDIAEEEVVAAIRQELGMPSLEPPVGVAAGRPAMPAAKKK